MGRETLHWAFQDPLRIRILEFAECKDPPPPSVSELKGALEGEFEDLSIRQVAYQDALLRDAGLLPRPRRRG